MMCVDKNVGLVAGTRGSIIPRKKANIHQLAFPFISMAASQLVQDLPEVHCHKVFFFLADHQSRECNVTYHSEAG